MSETIEELMEPGADQELTPKMAQDSSEALAAMVDQLSVDLRSAADRNDFYEEQIRKLQTKVETLQTDQVQQLLGPVLTTIAKLLTQATNSANAAAEQGDAYNAEIEFDYFIDAIVETLDLIGIDSVGAQAGDTFDRTRHAARKRVPTDDEGRDGTIAKVIRQGLIRRDADRAFIPAQVVVAKFDPHAAFHAEPKPALTVGPPGPPVTVEPTKPHRTFSKPSIPDPPEEPAAEKSYQVDAPSESARRPDEAPSAPQLPPVSAPPVLPRRVSVLPSPSTTTIQQPRYESGKQ